MTLVKVSNSRLPHPPGCGNVNALHLHNAIDDDLDLSAEEKAVLHRMVRTTDNTTGLVRETFEQIAAGAGLKSTRLLRDAFAIGNERLEIVKYFGHVRHGERYTNLWFRNGITTEFPHLYRSGAIEVSTTVEVAKKYARKALSGSPTEYRDGPVRYSLTTSTISTSTISTATLTTTPTSTITTTATDTSYEASPPTSAIELSDDDLLAMIETAVVKNDLKRLYVDHNGKEWSQHVEDAWRAKARSLKT